MKLRSAAIALVATLTYQTGAMAQQRVQPPTFRVNVDMVTVDVSVTRKGTPVSGLTIEDFEVADNGVNQKLHGVTSEQVPLEVFFVLDTSGSVAGQNLGQLVRAADAFVGGLSPRDRVSLVTFSEKILVPLALTPNLGSVRAALESAEARGRTALYDAVFVALKLRQPSDNRGVAIVFTDGYDNSSWLSEERVIGAADRSDLILYGVSVSGQLNRPFWQQSPENRFLRNAAAATGGLLFDANSWYQLGDAFARVLTNIRARYLLRFYPENVTRTGWHNLNVRLTRVGGEVTARRGYYVSPR